VRTVDEITPEDMRAWLKIDGIVQVVERTELVSFRWGVYGTPPELHPDVVSQMEADAAGSPVFRQVADGRQLCIRDLLAVAQEQGLKLHEGLPHDGTRRRHEVHINFPDNTVSILTTDGPRFLSEVRLGVEAFCEGTVQPLPAGFDYSDTKDSLARGIEHRPDIPGHDCIVTLVREPNSDEIKVNVMIRKKPEGDKPASPG
jgi:hypothetical protein